MQSLIDSLPGLLMPLSEAAAALDHMWEGEVNSSGAPSEFHATQMNLVLHFGLSTTPAQALAQFETAVAFAQLHPSRLIVLCPQDQRDPELRMQAKVWSQCYVGPQFRDMCCCEALILGYSPSDSRFLDDQVSLWLESDLPTYHWLHGVPAAAVTDHYLDFIARCRRVVFDSSNGAQDYGSVPWPRPAVVEDLARARTLPVRKSVGQFFSGFEPAVLLEGLTEIVQRYDEGFEAEAVHILEWQKECLEKCRQLTDPSAPSVRVTFEPMDIPSGQSIEIKWVYNRSNKYFRWKFRASSETGHLQADFGNTRHNQVLQIRKVPPAITLSEALFFND